MLSRKAKYALIASLNLARRPDRSPALIADLAEEENLPRKFLEAILLELRNTGILGSKKGKGGGYHLSRPASEIMVGSIVRAIDGPIAPLRCASQTAPEMCEECKDPATCSIRRVMIQVRTATAEVLDRTSLEDMIRTEAEAKTRQGKEIMYYI